MTNPYRSTHLTYRAVNPDSDLPLFLSLNDDQIGYQNSTPYNIHLPTVDDTKEFMKKMSAENLVFVVVCLPDPDPSAKPNATVSIGHLTLSKAAKRMDHHRSSEIGIGLLPEYQGKGYGSEVIRWALRFAFRSAGLHRVRIRALGWNEGAVRLYRKLGFREEGRERSAYWHEGRWWDGWDFAMLEDEWRSMEGEGEGKGAGKGA